jgi:hypothetical protein
MDIHVPFQFRQVVDEICNFDWQSITNDEMISVAHAYYYFSIQFRENLQVARSLYPDDENLIQLEQGECNTDNLSPWPAVAAVGERMDHDEFMRRTLALLPIEPKQAAEFRAMGEAYLTNVRARDPLARALSIASYEDGGLESVFKAILRCDSWDNAALRAFRHFLIEHIRFDSDPDEGHGALCRHLPPDDRVLVFWESFRDIFISFVPRFAEGPG